MYGYNTYVVWPVGGTAPDSFDPSDFPGTGTGASLGLKSVASGSGFTGSGYGTFATTQHADYQALGDIVEGKTGETRPIQSPGGGADPGAEPAPGTGPCRRTGLRRWAGRVAARQVK
ncbi:hypothetical protein SALBM311S_12014 [Streptomyces alboniger]